MRARSQALLQVCMALVCAVGAGFSGDLYAHHGPNSHHGSRHARGTHTRGNRSVSRTGQNDQSADVEVLLHEDHSSLSASQSPGLGVESAVVPEFSFVFPQFVQLALVEPVGVFSIRTAHSLARFGRAPPVLL